MCVGIVYIYRDCVYKVELTKFGGKVCVVAVCVGSVPTLFVESLHGPWKR